MSNDAISGADRLRWTMQHHGWRTAIVDVNANGLKISYQELASLVERVASGLRAQNIEEGGIVAYQLPNWWEFAVLTLAIWRLKAIAAPLLPSLGVREIVQMLKRSRARLWIIPSAYRGRDWPAVAQAVSQSLETPPQVIALRHESSGKEAGFALPTQACRKALLPKNWGDGDDIAQLLFTSGTTGEPKGVLHSHGSLARALTHHHERFGLDSNDTVFVPSPMAHQTGFLYGMYLAFYLGAKAVYLDRWDPGLAAAAIRENAVTFVQAALPFLVDLVRLSEPPSIRLFVATGSNIPGAVVRRLGPRLQGQIVKAWGSTETGLATAGVLTESQWKPWEHDGRAMPGATVLIRDSDRHTVPPGTEGRLWVRTDSMFVEYLNHPEWKNQALDPEGFFDTGDLAVMNFEGDMAITGRAKDVINRGGEKIPVVELEEILYQCPGVADVAIVAMPDERLGERACAYIVATEGTKAPGLQELRAYLEGQQFSKVYWPERVEILKELPRTASGKVQKFKLRQMAATAVAVPTAES